MGKIIAFDNKDTERSPSAEKDQYDAQAAAAALLALLSSDVIAKDPFSCTNYKPQNEFTERTQKTVCLLN